MRSVTSPGEQSQSADNASSAVDVLHPTILDKYTPGTKLGRGCFASVYKAERRLDNLPVAIKVVDKNRLDEDTANLLQNELQILQDVSEHPGIVTLLDSLETSSQMFFVMDFVEGGPLLDRIVSRGRFSENDARIMLRTVLLTLQFLSDLGFVHRDIKPENILVDDRSQTWPVKLTDFGFSAKLQPDKLLYGALGTPLFVAPEIFKGHGYDCSCDMWSLGVVLYIVLCGYPPFPFYDGASKLVTAIVSCDYSFPDPEWDRVSPDAKDVLTRMLEVDPAKRLTPAEALNHPWIRVAQSTSDLPNSNLKSFNARRKLKAVMFGVLTTFDLRKIVEASKRTPQNATTQRELMEDVERNRALIQKLGIMENSSAGADDSPTEQEQPRLKPSRRSLVLPVSIFDSEPADDDVSPTASAQNVQRFYNLSDSSAVNSQVMHSRTKAKVAEAKESPVLGDASNPFLAPCEDGKEEAGESGRRNLQLDLGSLGIR